MPASEPSDMPLTVDVSLLTEPARSALATAPIVTVPSAAVWTFDVPAITITANARRADPAPRPKAVTRSERRAAPLASAQAPASAAGSAVIEIAARYVGVAYVYGGTTPDGFDCSGFTGYVYAQLGIKLARTSAAQRYDGVEVPRDQARPGDLVWSPGHVGIYAGGNMMIDSPRPGKSVQFREMWQSNPIFIRVSG
ncbi:MAG TPA: C40 family peptidase [Propionicimonas sp.]|jgi:cell wall-associated NlpC family hydrolase